MTSDHEPAFTDDAHGRWLFVRARALAGVTAVSDLAEIYASLGVLTQEEALAAIKELKRFRLAFRVQMGLGKDG
jgi:hypothetical protein